MNYQSPLDESSLLCLEDKPVFSAVLIYEGLAAGRRAKQFYEKLTAEFDGDCRFTEDAWSFKVLRFAPIANVAASAAAAADIVHFFCIWKKPVASESRGVDRNVGVLDRPRKSCAGRTLRQP